MLVKNEYSVKNLPTKSPNKKKYFLKRTYISQEQHNL